VNYRSAEQDETLSSVKTSRENLSDGNAESKLLRDLGGINESKNLVFSPPIFREDKRLRSEKYPSRLLPDEYR
jgi:hypothetical protein